MRFEINIYKILKYKFLRICININFYIFSIKIIIKNIKKNFYPNIDLVLIEFTI